VRWFFDHFQPIKIEYEDLNIFDFGQKFAEIGQFSCFFPSYAHSPNGHSEIIFGKMAKN
jgi:hypothetical protein